MEYGEIGSGVQINIAVEIIADVLKNTFFVVIIL